MITYTIKTQTVKGRPVEVSVSVEGTEPRTGALLIALNMITDEQWNALVRKQKPE